MMGWVRSVLYNIIYSIYLRINIHEIPEDRLTVDDWGKVKEEAEKEIKVTKKIRKYAREQAVTPLNQVRRGRPTLRVSANQSVNLVRPYNKDNAEIELRLILAGLRRNE